MSLNQCAGLLQFLCVSVFLFVFLFKNSIIIVCDGAIIHVDSIPSKFYTCLLTLLVRRLSCGFVLTGVLPTRLLSNILSSLFQYSVVLILVLCESCITFGGLMAKRDKQASIKCSSQCETWVLN